MNFVIASFIPRFMTHLTLVTLIYVFYIYGNCNKPFSPLFYFTM